MLLLYGLTIFLGAFLLFLVQPLLGKYLLPWFGGGPSVWTVCLLFFQAALLGGYAYAHGISSRWRPRTQARVHIALLLLSLAFLPAIPDASWKPAGGADPTSRLLLLLGVTIGLPYLALSATGPLLQRWFSQLRPGVSPYRLYALSNIGSLLALVSYPLLVEPLWTRATQAWIWSGGMGLFAVLCGLCAWRIDRQVLPDPLTSAEPQSSEKISWRQIAWWLAFPAVASSLLAAITNKLTQEVAPVPFLWVVPLVVYLLSFILCFDHPRWYRRRIFVPLFALGCGAIVWMWHAGPAAPLALQLGVYPAVLFVACMICHGEVYRLRPGAAHLTRFYLCLAAGGVTGTLFVAVIAPRLYHDYYELQIGLCVLGYLLGLLSLGHGARKLAVAAWLGTLALAAGFFWMARIGRENVTVAMRNFYGTLQVLDVQIAGRPLDRHWELRHGKIAHGTQFQADARALRPTTYFGPTSGIGFLFDQLKPVPGRKVGVVGLGAGTLAAYGRSGDQFVFYEIDPAVVQIARSPFTFLKSSPAQIDVVVGDGRLSLENQLREGHPQNFDILVLDAFNSDAIPVHLLTVEALQIYLQHMNPDGVIALQMTNRFVDLRGVAVALSRRLQLDFLIIDDVPKPTQYWVNESRWCLLTRNRDLFRQWLPATPEARTALEDRYHPVLWTDDRASLLSVLRQSAKDN